MSNISMLTCLIIAGNENVRAVSNGPDPHTKKYAGWIILKLPDSIRLLVDTDPVFDTSNQAVLAMCNLVESARQIVNANP